MERSSFFVLRDSYFLVDDIWCSGLAVTICWAVRNIQIQYLSTQIPDRLVDVRDFMDQSFTKAWIRVKAKIGNLHDFRQIVGSSSQIIQEISVRIICYFASINLSRKGSQTLHVMLSRNRMRQAIHFVLVWVVK